MIIKKIFSNTLIYGLASQVTKLATLLVLPLVTSYLTELDFGIYGVVMATLTGVSAFANLGLNVVIANVFYKNSYHYKLAWRQLYGFLMLWNIIYALIVGLVLYLIIPEEASSNLYYIILLNILPIILFGPTALFGQLYYQFKEKPMQIAMRSIVFSLVSVSLSTWLIVDKGVGYLGWFIAISVSTTLSNISYWFPLNFKLGITPILLFKRRYIKNSLRTALPLVPHFYGNYLLNSSDQIIMKLMSVRTEDIGRYNVAYMFGNFIQQIGVALGKALGPMLYSSYKKKDEVQARNIVFSAQAAMLVGTFLVALWLKELFQVLINNEELKQMYLLGSIIIMSYSCRPMYLGANNRFFYLEKTKVLFKVSLAAGILNVILNVILIPIFGYEVAAYTTYLSIMYMSYIGYYLKEFKENSTISYYPSIWLTVTVFFTFFAYQFIDYSIIIKVIISIVSIIGVVLFLRETNIKQINSL